MWAAHEKVFRDEKGRSIPPPWAIESPTKNIPAIKQSDQEPRGSKGEGKGQTGEGTQPGPPSETHKKLI